jgi:hypothetical protein
VQTARGAFCATGWTKTSVWRGPAPYFEVVRTCRRRLDAAQISPADASPVRLGAGLDPVEFRLGKANCIRAERRIESLLGLCRTLHCLAKACEEGGLLFGRQVVDRALPGTRCPDALRRSRRLVSLHHDPSDSGRLQPRLGAARQVVATAAVLAGRLSRPRARHHASKRAMSRRYRSRVEAAREASA